MAADDRVLALSVQEGRVLVTNDRKTVTPLLMGLAEIGHHHPGVIFLARCDLPGCPRPAFL